MAASLGSCCLKHKLRSLLQLKREYLKQTLCLQRRYKSYKKFSFPTGRTETCLEIEVGHMAKFADGAVVAKYGETAVLVTAVSSRLEVTPTASFIPLTVDYRQKAAAAGRIPTNHLRRELGPSEKEILTGRAIDRSLRAMFPAGFYNETQITCNLLAVDGENDPDVLSINAASAALHLSDIPWNGPVGAVRIGCTSDEEICINPTRRQQQSSLMNVIITTDKNEQVVMLEGESKNVPVALFQKAVGHGAVYASEIAKSIASLDYEFPKKRKYNPPLEVEEQMILDVESAGASSINAVLNDFSHSKISRDKALQNSRYNIVSSLQDKYPDTAKLQLHEAVSIVIKKLFRAQIIDSHIRCDGRKADKVRTISSSVDLFKPLHGSALFQRGQTQVLCTVTFDSLQASLKTDPISALTGSMKEKNFMLHYEFPSYATNEIKQAGTKNRRELGHGALAEKGLRAIIPDKFPFIIRLTSEVLESNGSSSMASICGGSLALMDAGVQITEPAAGVAIGIVTKDHPVNPQNTASFHLLDDILGIEDYMGDMDFKVGGTLTGITALQMDLKIPGIPIKIVHEALNRAHKRIKMIVHKMKESANIHMPRDSIKSNGPHTENVMVLPAQRAQFIGAGGINLKKLQSETGVTITSVDESTFEIFAPNSEALKEAKEMMEEWLTAKKEPVLEFNAIYDAKITEIRDIGLMVQLHPAMNPVLLHNSQLDHRQVSHPSVLGFDVGQIIQVKYFGLDPASGKVRISRKVITRPSSRIFKMIEDS